MINIRKNEEIRHVGDLQNLITSVIFRQSSEFSKKDIYSKVYEYTRRSIFEGNPCVTQRIDDTINTLWIIGSITSKGNGYYLLSMSFPAI